MDQEIPPALPSDEFDACPWPALVLGADRRVQRANPAALRVFGSWAQGRSYVSVLRRPEVLSAIERAYRSGEPGHAPFLQTQAETERRFDIHVQPLQGASEKEVGSVALYFEDVSNAAQVASVRRDFVANVSHELRSPLTAIIGFIETLRGPAQDDAAARDRFLDMMQRETARMNRLIGDLLSLSRVEAQAAARPSDRVDLCLAINLALDPVRANLSEEAELSVDLPDQAFTWGDADQLQQVVANLVENALKYGDDPARLALWLTPVAHDAQIKGAAWALAVRDRGPGIEPYHIPRLTERFYRVDSHRSRAQGGTGLGLAIVKHIVNRHRGRVKIDSQVGAGTTVMVILPQA